MTLLLKLGISALSLAAVALGLRQLGKKSAAVKAEPAETDRADEKAAAAGQAEIYLAGGCFWGTEKYFNEVEGVLSTDVGYANGNGENPTYGQVSGGDTGFVETVHLVYDPERAPLPFLLELYYAVIDPTLVNRQGNDTGSQYRTGIFYLNEADAPIIRASLASLAQKYDQPLAVEAAPLLNYYPAEEYHQDYLEKHPGGYCHISPQAIKDAKSARPEPVQAPSEPG